MKYFNGIVLIAHILTIQFIETVPLNTGIEMPTTCAKKSYCFKKHDRYPQDKVDEVLNELSLSWLDGTENIGFRQGDSGDDCQKITSMDPIHEIVDQDGHVRVVLQSKNFTQIILTEECINPGPIRQLTEHFSFGEIGDGIDPSMRYNVSCVEKKINHTFLVLSLDGNSVETAMSQGGIPVCCSCRNENSSTRE